jgi:hypothetical protein
VKANVRRVRFDRFILDQVAWWGLLPATFSTLNGTPVVDNVLNNGDGVRARLYSDTVGTEISNSNNYLELLVVLPLFTGQFALLNVTIEGAPLQMPVAVGTRKFGDSVLIN